MADYIVHNVTTNQRQTCAAEDDAWTLIDPQDAESAAWLGPEDRWELLYLRNSLIYVLAWGTGPCRKDDWIRDHRLAPH